MRLQSEHTGALKLNGLRRIPGFLGLVERLDRGVIVVGGVSRGLAFRVLARLTKRDVSLPQEERGERSLRLLQVIDRGADVAEEVVGDAEFEVNLLLLWPGGDREPLGEGIQNLFEVADLRPALRKPFAEAVDHTAFEVFALNEQRPQIDEGFRHV